MTIDHHPPKERLYWLHTDGSGRRRAEDGRMVHPPLGCVAVGVLEDALRAKERRPDLTEDDGRHPSRVCLPG